MEPIYKIVILTRDTLEASLKLQASVYSGDATATQDVPAESLQGLRVQLVSPNVSGARDLIASGECTISGATLNVNLNAAGMIPGTHRLVVKAEYGTQTVVLYGLDITVPASFEEGDAQEFEDTITVVETIGDSTAGLVIDPTPTEDSTNPVASGGVYDALAGKADAFTTDPTPTEDSTNPVQSGGVYDALAGKQPVGNYADGSIYQVGESGEEGSEVENVAKVHAHGVELSNSCEATGLNAVAEGDGTTASGENSHADGIDTTASGENSHAEGNNTTARGNASHAEGGGTTASGENSHAEGSSTTASGEASHAEGVGTIASNTDSHAEGSGTTASGENSHAEGDRTTASGNASHAEGYNTIAGGENSHADGEGTIASQDAQHVSGKYNVEDTNGDYAFIVGNGADDQNRSNAFAIDWNGNLVLFNNGTPVVLTPAKLATLIA